MKQLHWASNLEVISAWTPFFCFLGVHVTAHCELLVPGRAGPAGKFVVKGQDGGILPAHNSWWNFRTEKANHVDEVCICFDIDIEMSVYLLLFVSSE